MSRPWIIAHRGASGHAPENTLTAFRRAAEMGAQFVESDLRVTSDGHFVLVHDARVNRTTDGKGRVDQLTLEATGRLDAGSWMGDEFAGERIPTLEETLSLVKELDLGLYLELKAPLVDHRPSILARMLRESGWMDRMVLLSFQPVALEAMIEAEPQVATALLVERAAHAVERAKQLGTRQLAPRHTGVTERDVGLAHQAGLTVAVWTVNTKREMRRMLSMGVDGIMTNYPDRLAKLLADAKPRQPG